MAKADFKDYYEILGVQREADSAAIKRAYRKLARQYHPDLNPDDPMAEDRFKEINEAYEVLSDAEKRQKYDQFGQYWQQPTPESAASGAGGFDEANFGQYSSFDDFINELLGRFGSRDPGDMSGGGRRTYAYRTTDGPEGFQAFSKGGVEMPPQDSEAAIALTFSEAFHGTQKRFDLAGEHISVRIPSGARPGSRIRIKGKGHVSPFNQQRGDLYLSIELLPHHFFQFVGKNILCEIPISPWEATLGSQIEVPTPDGRVTMTVPAGIDSGKTLRLKGQGWRTPKGERTDELVRIQIVSPKTLSQPERESWEKLQQISDFEPRQTLKEMQL